MSEIAVNEIFSSLNTEWELQQPITFTREEIMQLLADRIVRLLAMNSESFFQLMYRLDISEDKLHKALHSADVPFELAKTIYDRQYQKLYARSVFKKEMTDDPELSW